jgi:hypothetical protein
MNKDNGNSQSNGNDYLWNWNMFICPKCLEVSDWEDHWHTVNQLLGSLYAIGCGKKEGQSFTCCDRHAHLKIVGSVNIIWHLKHCPECCDELGRDYIPMVIRKPMAIDTNLPDAEIDELE